MSNDVEIERNTFKYKACIVYMPHRKCKGLDCGLIASFGYKLDGKGTKFCSKHKEDGMVNLLCKSCVCGKARPCYNYEGLKSDYCFSCKEEGMVNVNDTKCFCGRAKPCFNLPGLKEAYCSKCKLEGMISLRTKLCICGMSQPIFNFHGLKPEYCSKCKKEEMVDVVNKKCKCGTAAHFNFAGLKPEYCSKCRIEGMIELISKMCICKGAHPSFNYKGKTAEYCNNCKLDGMVNVVTKKCKGDFCIETSANPKYKGYCKHCYQLTFPNDPLTFQMKSKTKEIAVRDYINSIFDGFSHDQPLWTGNCDCTHRRRIDHRKLIGNTLLCIETDEYQHKGYNKTDEEIRYDDLFMIHGGKFIFIRFNPDKYTVNGKQRNPYIFVRLSVLEQEIKKQIKRIENDENAELLEIIKLYYDEFECKNAENTTKLENTFVENNSILNK